jgi:hypothetical protein
MSKLKNIAIGVGAFFGGRYLWSLYRAKNKVVTTVSAKRDRVTIQGVLIEVKYNIKNPTTVNLKMTPPLIKIHINNKLIASSTMLDIDIPQPAKDINGRIIIGKHTETGSISTKILLPWISLLSISPQLVTRLKSDKEEDKIKIQVVSTAQIFTLAGNYPYEEKTTIII